MNQHAVISRQNYKSCNNSPRAHFGNIHKFIEESVHPYINTTISILHTWVYVIPLYNMTHIVWSSSLSLSQSHIHHQHYFYLKHFKFKIRHCRPNWPFTEVGHYTEGQREGLVRGAGRACVCVHACTSACMSTNMVCACVCACTFYMLFQWLMITDVQLCLPDLPPPTVTPADGLFIKIFIFHSLSLSLALSLSLSLSLSLTHTHTHTHTYMHVQYICMYRQTDIQWAACTHTHTHTHTHTYIYIYIYMMYAQNVFSVWTWLHHAVTVWCVILFCLHSTMPAAKAFSSTHIHIKLKSPN